MVEHDPYAALKLPAYRWFFSGNLLANFGMHMQSTAVAHDIWQRSRSEWYLALAGLVQFLPVVTLFLWAGHAADRWNRRTIVAASQALVAAASVGLALIATFQWDFRWIFVCLLMVGIARTFSQPAKSSLLPQIVPADGASFTNAVTWNSSGFQLASVLGPVAAGAAIGWLNNSPVMIYWIDVIAASCLILAMTQIRAKRPEQRLSGVSLDALGAGMAFVRRSPIILGALSLDLFAVLFGGAVTLFPSYADKILHVDVQGLGAMRAAPAIGALCMGMWMAHRRPIRRTGRALLLSVAGFGIATIVYGWSTNLGLSLAMLFVTGALDNISVVIRHTLIQTLTPDALRGRVSAVNSLFIGASNELGGFESGMVAHYFGPVFSVVSGGIGTLVVVGWIAWALPELRRHEEHAEHRSVS